MMSGLMGTVAQGMAFGTGSAIAHRAVGAIADSFGGDDKAAAPQQEFQQQAPPAQFAQQSKVSLQLGVPFTIFEWSQCFLSSSLAF